VELKELEQINTELYLAKKALMDCLCFKTWRTFPWNYWRQNFK